MDVFSLYNRTPLTGIHVLYYDETDTLLSEQLTDLTGHATAPLPDGGTVVLVYESGTYRVMVVYRDIAPGSALRFGNYDYQISNGNPTLVRVTYPLRSGATSYTVRVACHDGYRNKSGPSPVVVTMYDCLIGDTGDIYVDAYAEETLVGTATLLDATIAANMAVTGAYVNPLPLAITVTNIPASFLNARVSFNTQRPNIATMDGDGYYFPVVSGQVTQSSSIRDIVGSNLSSQIRLIDGTKVKIITTLGVVAPAVTISAQELPPYAQTPIWDVATKSIVWSEVGSGSAELALGTFHFDRDGDNKAWLVMGSHDDSGLKIPTLPSEFSSYNPTDTDDVIVDQVRLIQAGEATETFRQDPLAAYDSLLEPGQRVAYSLSYN